MPLLHRAFDCLVEPWDIYFSIAGWYIIYVFPSIKYKAFNSSPLRPQYALHSRLELSWLRQPITANYPSPYETIPSRFEITSKSVSDIHVRVVLDYTTSLITLLKMSRLANKIVWTSDMWFSSFGHWLNLSCIPNCGLDISEDDVHDLKVEFERACFSLGVSVVSEGKRNFLLCEIDS